MSKFERNTDNLSKGVFDILVIGGGIVGAGCAWDAALRGYSVALVEKSDFGSATSAGCFKIVHGGLRYLQHGNILRLRESMREQRTLRRIAAHFVRPMPFLVPTYGYGLNSRLALTAGCSVYELLALDRNIGFDTAEKMSRHRLLSREEVLRISPGLANAPLSGGVVYQDCQMTNCDRLTLAVVQSAAAAGAVVCNYATAQSAELSNTNGSVRQVEAVSVKDEISGDTKSVRARFVINATGPWSQRLAESVFHSSGSEQGKVPPVFSKGIQLIVPQFVRGYALALESKFQDSTAAVSRGGRSYFVHPWRNHSLVGTSDSIYEGDPDDFRIDAKEIAELVNDVAGIYQDGVLKPEHVRYAFGGLRPVYGGAVSADAESGDATVAHKDVVVDHRLSKDPIANLISIHGVKYTTFRALSENIIDSVVKSVGPAVDPIESSSAPVCASKTAETPLYGSISGSKENFLESLKESFADLSEGDAEYLYSNYGAAARDIAEICREQPELSDVLGEADLPLGQGSNCLKAEVVYCARNEMVHSLSDVAYRRTGLGALGVTGTLPADILAQHSRPSREEQRKSFARSALGQLARTLAPELGWSREKQEEEVELTMAQLLAPGL
jgi:glycerol-3-phosphate dehydrogenase